MGGLLRDVEQELGRSHPLLRTDHELLIPLAVDGDSIRLEDGGQFANDERGGDARLGQGIADGIREEECGNTILPPCHQIVMLSLLDFASHHDFLIIAFFVREVNPRPICRASFLTRSRIASFEAAM